ncbi:MAG: radical SAM protein [Candidatus Wallbacteria bacterium]|nr:radical SAM protein [Candidatus Wallbacteria bacterium]
MQNNLSDTASICPECRKLIPAAYVERAGAVYLDKTCPEHGEFHSLVEEDARFFHRRAEFDKPATESIKQTVKTKGCPHDCGLCDQHDQHTCIAVLEITGECDLSCPVCYAQPLTGGFMALETVGKILDFYQHCESGNAEILQLSGGEPTLHPQLLKIIETAIDKKIKYVMLNTNGYNLAHNKELVKSLAGIGSGFEIYLQFDGLQPGSMQTLRGIDQLSWKIRALDNILESGIPVTLVTTVANGINDDQLGEILNYGISRPGIRGINFQAAAAFSPSSPVNAEQCITISGLAARLEKQTSGLIKINDLVPLPCNVHNHGLTFMVRNERGFQPITRQVDLKPHLDLIENSFYHDATGIMKKMESGLCGNSTVCKCMSFLTDFSTMLPELFKSGTLEQKRNFINHNLFRISLSRFNDLHSFALDAVAKECVHIFTPDLLRIPFSVYNLFHRGGKKAHAE